MRNDGWHVVTIWECAVKTIAAREWLWKRLPGLVEPERGEPVRKVAEDEAPYAVRKRRAGEMGRAAF